MSISNPIVSTIQLGPIPSSNRSNDHLTSPIHNHSNSAINIPPPPLITVEPPIPAYSPHSVIDIPAYEPPTTLSSSPGVVTESDAADSDFIQYARTHDHHEGAAGVVRRLPEPFPSDLASLRSNQPPESLPPYGVNDPPPYRRRIDNMQGEPDTLAMVFFKSGFCASHVLCELARHCCLPYGCVKLDATWTVFPAFWVFGALMLVTPLRSPNPFDPQAALSQLSGWPPRTEFIAWCNENIRTEEDKAEYLAKMHAAEMKWAKRCLLALVLLICFAVAIGATIFAVVKVQK